MDGDAIRAKRKSLGLTQAQFARRLGLSRDFIGQLERGAAPVAPRTALAIDGMRAKASASTGPRTTDPMERLIEDALIDAGIRYETDQGGQNPSRLDFRLSDHDVEIEVKLFHSERTGEQMKRAPNVIVAQGEPAVRFLAEAIRASGR